MTDLKREAERILDAGLARFGNQHPVVREVFTDEVVGILRSVRNKALESVIRLKSFPACSVEDGDCPSCRFVDEIRSLKSKDGE